MGVVCKIGVRKRENGGKSHPFHVQYTGFHPLRRGFYDQRFVQALAVAHEDLESPCCALNFSRSTSFCLMASPAAKALRPTSSATERL